VQLNVDPPPAKVFAEALVRLIVPAPVPAVVVKFVELALLKQVPELVITKVPPLNVRFFVPACVLNVAEATDIVNVLPLRSSVPLVRVTAPAPPAVTVKAP
jgi:hypothetical protein